MSQQKRGFRLPWAADHAGDGAAAAATLEARALGPNEGAADADPGDGPVLVAAESREPSTEPVPAGSDVPLPTAEDAMIDTRTAHDPSATGSEWPDADRRTPPRPAADDGHATARPPIRASGEARTTRRENPLVAGLVKAMREAAVASRDETLARLHAEAEARVVGIRGRATSEAAELKQRADGDIAEIREWSKAEIARIREETEARIEARKADLAGEAERHAASVERLVGDVDAVVASYEAEMGAFFERLLAEDDPARLAALAEQAPGAPDLSGEGPAALDLLDEPAAALAADDAAAAEVAASEGLDMGAADGWPAAAVANRTPAPHGSDGPGADGATRLLVTGLTSVAGISAFKGALGQLPGVQGVSVSSGEPGVFVFAVAHDRAVDLAAGVAGLSGFAARITDATDSGIAVVAHEPAA